MKGSRTVAIVQARMSSRRLPGKVLLDIAGKPMLARVVERARRARTLDEVLVATTTDPADQAIVEQCEARQYPYFRGSLHDVLDRYYQAALSSGAQNVVRLTADCPLIDPQVIDQTVRAFLGLELGLQEGGSQERRGPQGAEGAANPPWDFAANRLPPPFSRTFPIGLDTEVCTFAALERAWREARLPHQREHVMPYLYEDSRVVDWRDRSKASPGGRFRALLVNHDPDYGHLRWTVDTRQDLDLVRAIYTHFGGRDDFSWLEVLTLFEKEPSLAQVNASVPAKYVQESEMKGS